MKRLIVCCDGTWNRADQAHNGVPCPTNVVRIAYRTAKRSDDIQQIVYYGEGVGTGNSLDKISGGAFGKGIEENIFGAYRFLIANYEPDDELYFFGFSRGAYTARSVCGMVRKCGILSREHVNRYIEALDLYRSGEHPDQDGPREFRRKYSVNSENPTPIKFIGVWDTVGALGIPLRGLRWMTRDKYQFHDTELSGSVKFACHALAIDERRAPFEPTLWAFQPKPGQVIEQAWFPGVHSNVGGGYEDHSLSDHALEWIISKAQEAGLAVDARVEHAHPLAPDSAGKIYESKKGFYRATPGLDRVIGQSVQHDQNAEITGAVDDPTQFIHQSALDRWDSDIDYRPPNLMEYFRRTGDSRGQ